MPYHSTIITPIKTCRKKCLSSHNCHFVKNYLFNIKRLHVNVQCVCIVKAKYLIDLSKTVLGVDLLVYAQGFPSVLYFKSPRDPHKNFLRVQGKISRVLNPEIFSVHIQFKDQNCLNVQCSCHFTEYISDFIISIRILLFYSLSYFILRVLEDSPGFC